MNPPHIGNKNVSEQSMSSLVVKNDLYTYEITTLIQYFKSPNTPSLTLIPYELWAKVGNNSVLCHYKTHCYKSPRQEAGTKLVDAEVTPCMWVDTSPVLIPQQNCAEGPMGPSIKATLEVLI